LEEIGFGMNVLRLFSGSDSIVYCSIGNEIAFQKEYVKLDKRVHAKMFFKYLEKNTLKRTYKLKLAYTVVK
jgi:hypothetical protein